MAVVERLAHFLTGWVEFEVRGNGPRFFNTAAKAGVEFWGFSRRGERLSARGTPGDYKRLRELARRSGAHPTIVARGGLPFTTARLKRRKGLVVGAAAGTAVYLFLSGFCWGVTVTGAETLTRLQVLEAARQSGLSVGAPLREMDYKAVALSIQNRLEGVTWLSVNNNGCFVEVSLRESLPAPEVVNDREWSNMVAARPGTILSVEAERGRPVVSPGDTVTAGQLLIAGLYEQELDPYSPPPDEPYQVLGAARGSVRALTYREFSVEVPQEKTVLVPTGRRSQAALEVFGLRVPLGLARQPEGSFRVWRSSTAWNPLGRALPLAWEVTTWETCREEAVPLEEAGQEEAALLALRRLQREELPPGSKVEEEELSYTGKGAARRLKAVCRCEEEIGLVRKISVE